MHSPVPRSASLPVEHSINLLNQIADELKALYRVDCPIKFVDKLGARGKYYPRLKEIRICTSQTILQVIECICHEIVHYKQHVLGTWRMIAPNHHWYKGQWYENVPYKDQPWEHEANKHMRPMFRHFVSKASRSLMEEVCALAGVSYAKST